jgi:hypothetical protein
MWIKRNLLRAAPPIFKKYLGGISDAGIIGRGRCSELFRRKYIFWSDFIARVCRLDDPGVAAAGQLGRMLAPGLPPSN